MREIKFRAWDKINKQMLIVETLDGLSVYLNDIIDNEGDEYKSSDIEIMQYTGLKDKNGKEIYEGDIVKYLDIFDEEIVSEIHFNEGAFEIGEERKRLDQIASFRIEIIGNIYENGDLLTTPYKG